jgi:phospholipid/cholesterol/gamma-HCH transport system ATP-binding protein
MLGKSGTGKSVTLKCIIGLIRPDSGTVRVFDRDIFNVKPDELKQLRERIGYVFQNGALYDSMSLRENLEFPLKRHYKLNKEEIDAKVMKALEDVDLDDAIDKMPSELSGGMKKRAGIARTLILKPEVMLWDEPTTGLDPETTREISKMINRMKERYKVSSIVITHDMICAKMVADRIVVLKEGEFIAEGTYDELEKSNNEFVKSFFE